MRLRERLLPKRREPAEGLLLGVGESCGIRCKRTDATHRADALAKRAPHSRSAECAEARAEAAEARAGAAEPRAEAVAHRRAAEKPASQARLRERIRGEELIAVHSNASGCEVVEVGPDRLLVSARTPLG
jgi:hypothetical protein